jgi:serine/threonine protein kinase
VKEEPLVSKEMTRYQALGPLLASGGSRAFLGLRLQPHAPPQPVALVWLDAEVADDPSALARLVAETERAATLEHPNITRVFGLAELDEGIARVVEFVDGESLRSVLQAAGKLPPRMAARVVWDVATGLHFAHVAGNDDGSPLVHGGVRPDTVMVSFGGVSKVAGYGASALAPRRGTGTRAAPYLAPELLISSELTAVRTDVYLLGLLLQECLTGQSAALDAAWQLFSEETPLRPAPEVPEPLARVIRVATARRFEARYPSAFAVREAIEEAQPDLAPHAECAAFLERHFPVRGEVRSLRRRELEAGLAEAEGPAPTAIDITLAGGLAYATAGLK